MLRFRLCCGALVYRWMVRADEPAKPQWRAVWVDAFNPGIKTPQQVDQLIGRREIAEFQDDYRPGPQRELIPFTRKSLEPFTEDATSRPVSIHSPTYWEKGHKAGLQVHAWVNSECMWPGSGPAPKDPKHIFNAHGPTATDDETWLTRDDEGKINSPLVTLPIPVIRVCPPLH